MSSNVNDILTDAVNNDLPEGIDPNTLSLEALILLINSERLRSLQEKTQAEFDQLKERQDKVEELHNILKTINAETKEKGELDMSKNDALKDILERAKELGVDIKEGKTKFNSAERERLVENIRMTVEDLNTDNDMQLQAITRYTNERQESYQMARSIMKPLHETKTTLARSLRGA